MEADLDFLPEELKTHIISYLNDEPPSTSWYKRTPRLCLGGSNSTPLKNLSRASKSWRRLTKTALFRCIRINIVALREDALFAFYRPWTTNFRHAVEVRKHNFRDWLFRRAGYPTDTEWIYRHAWQDTAPQRASHWLTALDSTLSDLLVFLTANELCSNVESVSVMAEGELDDNSSDYIRNEVHCLIGSATFWEVLFRNIEPSQITLVAPPSTLACLLNCSIRMLDSWAFAGMDYELVTLRRTKGPSQVWAKPKLINDDGCESVHLRASPADYARPALASVLYIRPWSHLIINEGSYLAAYSTYEYFHKEPPGIIYPLAQGFEVPMSLDTLTYHSIFPFHDYLAAAVNLMSTGIIRNLHVQLAPSATDTNWDDPSLVGKADLTDCWSEIQQVYALLFTGPSANPNHEDGHLAAHSNITTFSSGDCRIESIAQFLERSFGVLGWDETVKGTWKITEAAAARRRQIQGIDEE